MHAKTGYPLLTQPSTHELCPPNYLTLRMGPVQGDGAQARIGKSALVHKVCTQLQHGLLDERIMP